MYENSGKYVKRNLIITLIIFAIGIFVYYILKLLGIELPEPK